MTHENENFGGRAEHPGSDEQKISAMLGGLKRVEAPKDFEFHVKARIANARPETSTVRNFLPILKYVMPLALFLVVGAGFFAYDSVSTPPDITAVAPPDAGSPIALTFPEDRVTAPAPQPKDVVPDSGVTVAAAEPAQPKPGRTEPRVAVPSSEKDGGGSRDFGPGGSRAVTLGVAPTPRNPPGLQLNQLGVTEAFRLIGAEASFEGGSWTVKSIADKSVAERIGMRPGDKLKAVDGKPVVESTQFDPKFSARSIEVVRGAATVDLTLTGERENR